MKLIRMIIPSTWMRTSSGPKYTEYIKLSKRHPEKITLRKVNRGVSFRVTNKPWLDEIYLTRRRAQEIAKEYMEENK